MTGKHAFKLLQVCNVGRICGGTAACAWTITRAFPDWNHHVLFLSGIESKTRQHFQGSVIHQSQKLNDSLLASIHPDLILLHNTGPEHAPSLQHVPSIQFHHSVGQRARASIHVSCSAWLKGQIRQPSSVLYQPVTRPIVPLFLPKRRLEKDLIVGRICTPSSRKWSEDIAETYRVVGRSLPQVRWEFVGCPAHLRSAWATACAGKVTFHEASWEARSRLHHWHALLYHHPTVTESFGRVCAEAMRSGCLPIVDDRGGFREQIHHGENGFLCRSSQDFINAVQKISNLDHWQKLSRNAVQSADQKFSLKTFREKFLEVLSQLKTPQNSF